MHEFDREIENRCIQQDRIQKTLKEHELNINILYIQYTCFGLSVRHPQKIRSMMYKIDPNSKFSVRTTLASFSKDLTDWSFNPRDSKAHASTSKLVERLPVHWIMSLPLMPFAYFSQWDPRRTLDLTRAMCSHFGARTGTNFGFLLLGMSKARNTDLTDPLLSEYGHGWIHYIRGTLTTKYLQYHKLRRQHRSTGSAQPVHRLHGACLIWKQLGVSHSTCGDSSHFQRQIGNPMGRYHYHKKISRYMWRRHIKRLIDKLEVPSSINRQFQMFRYVGRLTDLISSRYQRADSCCPGTLRTWDATGCHEHLAKKVITNPTEMVQLGSRNIHQQALRSSRYKQINHERRNPWKAKSEADGKGAYVNLKVCVCCIPIGIYTHKKLQLNRNQITFTQPFPIGTCIGCPRDLDQSEHHESRSYGRCKSVRVEKMGRSSSIGSNIIFNRFHPHRFIFLYLSVWNLSFGKCV